MPSHHDAQLSSQLSTIHFKLPPGYMQHAPMDKDPRERYNAVQWVLCGVCRAKHVGSLTTSAAQGLRIQVLSVAWIANCDGVLCI